ncbi:MAG: curli production assembly protein CsgG [Acidobacteria bacterium]|nr:curli production assembly protein CsgG [Acidobacteriota bacterium]
MRRFLLIAFLFIVWIPSADAQTKPRVAILDFDYATVRDISSSIFGTDVDIGKGISDMLVEKLVNGGVYSVIERKALDTIIAEQNLSNSDRFDSSSAAKIGRLLGVDAIITGSITQFGRDDKSTNVGGGAVGGITRRFGIGGVGRKQSKAVVAITARVINTDTAEILSVATGNGESKRSGTTLLGAGGSSGAAAGGVVDMRSSNFASTILGEAVGQAVISVATQLQEKSTSLPARVVKIDGLVADATGNELILNVGSKAGVKVGDRLKVFRTGREIRDPASGKVIRRVEESLGEVVITEVDEQSAVGKYSGTSPAKVGDRVHN